MTIGSKSKITHDPEEQFSHINLLQIKNIQLKEDISTLKIELNKYISQQATHLNQYLDDKFQQYDLEVSSKIEKILQIVESSNFNLKKEKNTYQGIELRI